MLKRVAPEEEEAELPEKKAKHAAPHTEQSKHPAPRELLEQRLEYKLSRNDDVDKWHLVIVKEKCNAAPLGWYRCALDEDTTVALFFENCHRDIVWRNAAAAAAADEEEEEPNASAPKAKAGAQYPQGVLSVTPGFSDDVAEDAAQQAQAMSLAASGHGGAADSNPHLLPPRIQSFTFTTPAGSTYEYTVENAAELADMDDEAKLTRADEAVAAAEASRWRLLTGTAFGGAPPAGHTRVFVNAEIVSGARFDGDALYAKYEVTLPPDGGWQWAADQGGGDSAGGGMGHGDGSTPSSSSAAAAATDGGGEGHGGHGIGAAAPTHRGFTTRCTVRGISQQAATSYTHPAGYRRGEELPDADGIFADPTDATEVRKEERKTGRQNSSSFLRACLPIRRVNSARPSPARPPFALCPPV